ncbi:MAG: hypothetical protein CME70_16285 [Halobacteriovorax sp.]|nr:hypothetical protein [Halobacteriovorax sp.]|tara:strand:+ start:122948 stop:123253 length:306 start_codon:yes stop_codon:yes gene_type:complete
MKIVNGDYSPMSKEVFTKIQNNYPEARNFKFSIKEDNHSFFTTTLEVRVGKKKLVAKKIGASANESVRNALSALKKRLEKIADRSNRKKKHFFSFSSLHAI